MDEDGQEPASSVDEVVPVEFTVRVSYSPHGKDLSKGSRYSFGPVPTAVEYELTYVNGDPWIVWVWHTPQGVQRYAMPKPVAEGSWDRLGRVLGKGDPQIEIATSIPDEPVPGE